MGRKKIKVKRIEDEKERCSKFSKRKRGILKKAEEISVLCDVDIAILFFSPTSKPSLFHPHSRPFSRILERFSTISIHEREERRAYTTKTLKKMCKNNPEITSENHHLSSKRDEVFQEDDKEIELRETRESLDRKMSILRDWQNPYEVNNMDRLDIMEKYLVSSLTKIQKIKSQEENQPIFI